MMSGEPTSRDQVTETPTLDGTGVFQPESTEPPAGNAESDATVVVEGSTPEATGVYLPSNVPSEEKHQGAEVPPEATGVYLPGVSAEAETAATGAFVPEPPGATGVYVPEATQVPGEGKHTDEGVPAGTAMYTPAETQAPAGHGTQSPPQAVADDLTGSTVMVEASTPASPPRGQAQDSAAMCGRYVLKRFHAKGGMGEIWLADDPAIGRSVALKRMLGKRADQQYRFLVEAQVTGQLEHPGIVPVHELGLTVGGQPFYTMKFVRGRTLQKLVQEFHAAKLEASAREVEQVRLLQVFLALCQTVAYAHSRGVIHRDLKPENVMVGPFGETLLLDWGIAKVLNQPETPPRAEEAPPVSIVEAEADTATQAGAILGSPSYMAPEVAAGLSGEVDQRSDIYLLGATLYEILTGKLPRTGKTVLDLMKQAQRQTPVEPRKVNPQVSRPLNAICTKAMAMRKDDRYAAAQALAEDVQRYLAGEPVSAYREGLLARGWRWVKRHRRALGRAAAAALVLALVLFGSAALRDAERRRALAQQEAEQLRELDQARRDLAAFRRLTDEARFYSATTDAVTEHAPYFDPQKGETTARAALALAAGWGPTLERFPLPEERAGIQGELYDLLLLLAQARIQSTAEPAAVREALTLLDEAGQRHAPSRAYYRLRARAGQQLGDIELVALAQQRLEDAQTPATALDHFLLGEEHRKAAPGRGDPKSERKAWQPDPEQLHKAIDEYRRALLLDPGQYWAHFQLARSYLGLGRHAEAVEALSACVALRPESPWGYSVRGVALAQQKRYAEAERDLDRALALAPDSRPPRLNRGVVYWTQGKQDQALADFAAVLEPPSAQRLIEAAYYRGQLLLQRGEVAKALEDFDRVVAENPRFRPVYPLRARILITQGDSARALADLDAYLADSRPVERDSWQAHGQRGRVLRVMYAELPLDQRAQPAARALANLALAELQQAVTKGARAAAVFDDLGAMLELTGQPRAALDSYTRGLQLAPQDVKLLVKRGWLHEALNQRANSQADFAAAIRIDPENAEAHTGLGYVRALEKLSPDAQRAADLALLHGSENYLILHNVACIYAALSQTDPAQAAPCQEVAVLLLQRAVKLWKKAGTGPSEIALIKGDATFKPLHGRADFRKLLEENQ